MIIFWIPTFYERVIAYFTSLKHTHSIMGEREPLSTIFKTWIKKLKSNVIESSKYIGYFGEKMQHKIVSTI